MEKYIKHKLQLVVLGLVLGSITACSSDDKDTATATSVAPENPAVAPTTPTSQPKLDLEEFTKGLSATTTVTDGSGNTYTVSYAQVTSNNQNPVVEKKNAKGVRIWKKEYENTGVDGRAGLIALDENNIPWVVFSVDGGDVTDNYITKKEAESDAFSNVYNDSYQSGGGPRVNILAKLNPETGKITKGAFLIAKKDDNKTNSFGIIKLGFKGGKVAFEASTAAWPPGKGKGYVRFPKITNDDRYGNYFRLYYEMKTDLSEITEAVFFKK